MRVGSIGDNCLDVYLDKNILTAGGNALNVAVNWMNRGHDATYWGAVGDDEEARLLTDQIHSTGLTTSCNLTVLPGATGVTLIRLRGSDREFVYEQFGVGECWQPSDEIIDAAAGLDWVHTTGTAGSARVTERLVGRGARVSVDLSTYHDLESIDGVEIAFASWVEAPTGPTVDSPTRLAERILDAGAGTAVVTCGASGSLSLGPDGAHESAALPISPVDTCGAGDSFIASYITSYAADLSPEARLTEATRQASLTCQHLGGFQQEQTPVPAWLIPKYLSRVPDHGNSLTDGAP